MEIADAAGLPVAAHVEGASPHIVTLVEATIDSCFTQHAPDKLIGDKAYASDGLDEKLPDERGIEMIAPPARRGAKKKPRVAESFDFMFEDGRSNVFLPGSKILGTLLSVTSTMQKTFLGW
jgi:hypothetical protein